MIKFNGSGKKEWALIEASFNLEIKGDKVVPSVESLRLKEFLKSQFATTTAKDTIQQIRETVDGSMLICRCWKARKSKRLMPEG